MTKASLLGKPFLVLTMLAMSLLSALGSSPALAAGGATAVLTGHDMDYHCYYGDSNECAYFKIVLDLARNGSTLPVLTIDQGVEATGAVNKIYGAGTAVTVNPTSATFATLPFVDASGNPLYSAIVTASDSTCGGCDNTPAGEAAINARAADFKTFFNAGGGIVALAGANNYATYYNFVPVAATGASVTYPFAPTAYGASLGITSAMANCCATHNSFQNPPSGSALKVAETDGAGIAETLIAQNASIGGGGFTSDTTPPTCALAGVVKNAAGQTTAIQIAVQDSDGGLASVAVTELANATADVGAYQTGIASAPTTVAITDQTKGVVTVTANKVDLTAGASIALTAKDVAGNSVSCDPVSVSAVRADGKPVTQQVSGVQKADTKLTVVNDGRAVDNLSVSVNGHTFKVNGLKAGDKASVDISSALTAGTNQVSATLAGKPGASATLLFGNI